MKLFQKREKVNIDDLFKEKYKQINLIVQSANEELDYTIKLSSLKLACNMYDELIDLIDRGANYDKQYFLSLQQSVNKEISIIENLK